MCQVSYHVLLFSLSYVSVPITQSRRCNFQFTDNTEYQKFKLFVCHTNRSMIKIKTKQIFGSYSGAIFNGVSQVNFRAISKMLQPIIYKFCFVSSAQWLCSSYNQIDLSFIVYLHSSEDPTLTVSFHGGHSTSWTLFI